MISAPAKSINNWELGRDKMLLFISVILYASVQSEKFTDELSISVLVAE